MTNFADLITIFFFAVLLVLCIFVVVHATLQIKNCQYNTFSTSPVENKKNKNKMIKILVIGLILFACILFKIMTNISSFKASEDIIDNYKNTTTELNMALSLEFSTYKDCSYSSAEKLAKFIYTQLPIMDTFYLKTRYTTNNEFSKNEIYQFNLKDFVDKPTLLTYDGILMSIIKFKEGCNYVNKAFLGKSDCLIEVDANNYNKPNQIGQDRTLFAIDGKNNKIIADRNFLEK